MTNYLAAIDLADEESRENILRTAVEMATGVEGARIFLMTVIPGVPAGLDVRYADSRRDAGLRGLPVAGVEG